MSIFNNIKDSLNLDDQGEFDGQYYYNNDQFGPDGSHQGAFGGFGGAAYSGHSGLAQMQGQRSGLPVGLNQQQQQQSGGLFRGGNAHPSMQGGDSGHYMGAGNAVQRPAGFNQNSGLLGGAIGLGGLPQSRSGLPGNVDPSSLNRFGVPSSMNAATSNQMRPSDDDFHSLTENEDFPALPTTSKSDAGSIGLMGSNSVIGKESGASILGAVGSAVEKGRASSIGSSAGDSSSVLGATPQQASGASGLLANLNAAAASTSHQVNMSKEMKFGLAGLLETIRGTDKDGYQLALGTDLTTFGLNLNAVEPLYPNFTSPFQENSLDDVPYKIPPSYHMNATTIKLDHFGKFQLETLFYMFYQMPKDIFQALAAQELYKRDWRYHGELKIWLKPRTQQEIMQAHPTVQFLYFDTKSFETRLFNAPQFRGNLLAGIVPEEEIRVRGPGGGPIGESS